VNAAHAPNPPHASMQEGMARVWALYDIEFAEAELVS
jgi:hypothetical protein